MKGIANFRANSMFLTSPGGKGRIFPNMRKASTKMDFKRKSKKPTYTDFEKTMGLVNDESDVYSGIEDGRRTKFFHTRFLILELSCAIFSLLGIMLSVLQYDISFTKTQEKVDDALLIVIYVTTVFLVALTVIKSFVLLKLEKERKSITGLDNLWTSGMTKMLTFELLIILPHPNPFLKGKFFSSYSYQADVTIYYEYNHFFSIYIMLRVVLLLKCFLSFTSFLSPRAYRLCKIYGCEFGYSFAIKSFMKTQPNRILITLLAISIFWFAHILRICERPLSLVVSDPNINFGYYFNSLWCVVITMFTIGYGDYYPRTSLGRISVFVLGLWGSFVISLMVVTLSNILEMDGAESKSISLLMRLNYRKKLQKEAAYIMTGVSKIKMKRGLENKSRNSKKYLINLKQHLNTFGQYSRKIKSTFDTNSLFEVMGRHFDFLRNEIRLLQRNQENVVKKLGMNPINWNQQNKLDLIKKLEKKRNYLSNPSKSQSSASLINGTISSMVKYAITTPKGKEEYNVFDWNNKDKDERVHNDLIVKNHDAHMGISKKDDNREESVDELVKEINAELGRKRLSDVIIESDSDQG